ncbi:MAG: Gfo/Idh/MocA family oxidoreductase [Candidatus Aminicenantes bacterium]|jgi:predicted dehydrogenase
MDSSMKLVKTQDFNKRPLLLGLIGCGHIVEVGHLPAYAALQDGIVVKSLADTQTARQNIIGEKLNIPITSRYSDYIAMLENEALDLVVIGLPPHLHKDAIIAVSQRGLAIICEKPLCLNSTEANIICQSIKDNNTFFAILHNYLYQAGWKQLIKEIHNGKIGKPLFLRQNELSSTPWDSYSNETISWRTDPLQGGGPLWDSLYHTCYLSEALLMMPIKSIKAHLGKLTEKYKSEDTVVVIFIHENNRIADIFYSWSYSGRASAEVQVVGEKGVLKYAYWRQPDCIHLEHAKYDETILVTGWDELEEWGYHHAFHEIFNACLSGAPPPYGISDAMNVLHILEMSRYSSYQLPIV